MAADVSSNSDDASASSEEEEEEEEEESSNCNAEDASATLENKGTAVWKKYAATVVPQETAPIQRIIDLEKEVEQLKNELANIHVAAPARKLRQNSLNPAFELLREENKALMLDTEKLSRLNKLQEETIIHLKEGKSGF